jgi:hypothetical protein
MGTALTESQGVVYRFLACRSPAFWVIIKAERDGKQIKRSISNGILRARVT